jgi:hypothetical protein
MATFDPGQPTHADLPPAPDVAGTYGLVEVYRITERRDDAIYRTEWVGFAWRLLGDSSQHSIPDLMYSSLSTKQAERLLADNFFTIIKVR